MVMLHVYGNCFSKSFANVLLGGEERERNGERMLFLVELGSSLLQRCALNVNLAS